MKFINKNMNKHDGIIRCLSLSMIVIASGLFISLPFLKNTKPKRDEVPSHIANLAKLDQICQPDTKERQWEYIVIHHSATAKGNATQFDHYHKKTKGWEYGLAYHFVIGNGSYSGDGEVEVANRWKKQVHGAHTANMDCNRVGIGICLVGDFENEGIPTENQFESLVNLVQYLCRKYSIPSSNILEHKHVHQKATACPGKNFPFSELKTRLTQIASKAKNHKEL